MSLEMPNFDPNKNFSKKMLDLASSLEESSGSIEFTPNLGETIQGPSHTSEKAILKGVVDLTSLSYVDLPAIIQSKGAVIISKNLISEHISKSEADRKILMFENVMISEFVVEEERGQIRNYFKAYPGLVSKKIFFASEPSV